VNTEMTRKKKKRLTVLERREAAAGILLVLPFLAGFLLFYIIPFGISVFYSFTSGLIGDSAFAGLENYVQVFGSFAFRKAALNTFRFMGIGIPLIMAVSLGLSLLMSGGGGKTAAFQQFFLYPLVVPVGASVMFFQVMLSEYGVLNHACRVLGLPVREWLESGYAFYVLLFLYIWKNCGYNIVLFMTGLAAIPREYREAAQVEGAGGWQYFRWVECPLLVPSFLFVFVMSVVNSFKCYREAYLLGGKYPHDSIYMLQHYMNNNFENLNYQRLSVAALLVFSVIFLLTARLFAAKRRMEEEPSAGRRGHAGKKEQRLAERG